MKLAVEHFGQGPPLIFAHGLSSNRQASRRQLAPLGARFQVIVFDQRGHGDSTPIDDPSLYGVDAMAADIGAVLDALGTDRAVVGGESMGAATALAFALRNPNKVEALLLTAPAFGDVPNTELAWFEEVAATLASSGVDDFLVEARNRWREDLAWPPEAIETVAGLFRSHDPRSLATAMRNVIRWLPFPDLTSLGQLPCPCCILYWQTDPLHPADLAFRLARELPECTLLEMAPPPAIFVCPDQVGELYGQFLGKRHV